MTSIQLWTECESDRGMIVTSPRTSAYVRRHIELRPECNFPSKGGLNLSNIQWRANYDVMSNKGLTVTSRDLHCHKVKLRTTLDFYVFPSTSPEHWCLQNCMGLLFVTQLIWSQQTDIYWESPQTSYLLNIAAIVDFSVKQAQLSIC